MLRSALPRRFLLKLEGFEMRCGMKFFAFAKIGEIYDAQLARNFLIMQLLVADLFEIMVILS